MTNQDKKTSSGKENPNYGDIHFPLIHIRISGFLTVSQTQNGKLKHYNFVKL